MTIHEITARHITLRVTSHPILSHHTASHDIASHDGTSHHMRGMAHLSFLPGTQFRLARSEPLRNARRLHVEETRPASGISGASPSLLVRAGHDPDNGDSRSALHAGLTGAGQIRLLGGSGLKKRALSVVRL